MVGHRDDDDDGAGSGVGGVSAARGGHMRVPDTANDRWPAAYVAAADAQVAARGSRRAY